MRGRIKHIQNLRIKLSFQQTNSQGELYMSFDYKGKRVFVGIDVHKKSYSVVSICDGELVKKDKLASSPEGLVSYLKKYFPEGKIISAYEAGFSGFELHRYLVSEGIDNLVVHAASIEVSSRDRVKTDKRDALKIAIQLSANRLKGIYVPSRDQESRRRLSRMREQLVKDRRRVGNRLKSLLYVLGYRLSEDKKKAKNGC